MTEEAKQRYLSTYSEKVAIDTIELKYPNNSKIWRFCLYPTPITKKIEDDSLVEFVPFNFKVGFPKKSEFMDYQFPLVLDGADASIYEELTEYLANSNEAVDFKWKMYFEDSVDIQASSDMPYKLYSPTFNFTENSLTFSGGLPDFVNQTLSAKKYNYVDFPMLKSVYA